MLVAFVFPPFLYAWRSSLRKYFVGLIFLVFLTSTYLNLFMIYSIANLHDISWGTREGGDANKEEVSRLQSFRTSRFVTWMGANVIYGYLIISLNSADIGHTWIATTKWCLQIVAVTVGVVLLLRVILAILFKMHYECCSARKI